VTRRTLLAAPFLGEGRVRREVFLRSPGKGTAVMAHAVYLRPKGVEMVSFEQRMSRSDTVDVSFRRRSTDNGRTWSAPQQRSTRETRPEGTLRRHFCGGWVDPAAGAYIEFFLEGVLPTDNPLEGMRQWAVYYRIGEDGPVQQVIQRGAEFNPRHPVEGVYIGKNCMMLGDLGSRPLGLADGSILLPLQISPLGRDGALYNPTGGYTYTDALIAIGRWKGRRLEWEVGDPIPGDPKRSTRGMVEPTLGVLDDGRVIAVMRGSNDKNHDLPAHKWISYSRDGGRRWTRPEPWTYTSGDPFYSPSACSQLLRHSSGRLFWLGNITPANPKGNRPRYPFVIGEVDRRSGLLKRDSLIQVDDRSPAESDVLTLSNFLARENRETREIALHMTRLFALRDGWEGDALLYHIRV